MPTTAASNACWSDALDAGAGTNPAMTAGCELCAQPGGRVLADDGRLRVVAVDDADYPGFLRVIWNAHVRELTDLDEPDALHLLRVLRRVEAAQRRVLSPLKMNVASLGNQVPHLHWHLIPRYADDAHFPQPVWGSRQRETPAGAIAARRTLLPELEREMTAVLSRRHPDS